MASAVVWADVVHLGRRAAKKFRLRWASRLRFEPFPPHKRLKIDGRCWWTKGLIQLRLHRVGKPKQPLSTATIMATLAHELAHLPGHRRGALAHGAEHGELTRKIAAWLREQGQPVSHVMHSGSYAAGMPRTANRPLYKRAWKRPKPRRKPK